MNAACRTRGFVMRDFERRAYIMEMRPGIGSLSQRARVWQQGDARLPQYQEENRNPNRTASLIRPENQCFSPNGFIVSQL